MNQLHLTLFAIFCTFYICTATQGRFSYGRNDLKYGPSTWPKNFPLCGGEKNSPIDFSQTIRRPAAKWKLTGWDRQSHFTVSDGDTNVEWTPEAGERSVVSGGGLTAIYDLVNIHIHWGADNTKGSEHTVDGKRYPMEIHFVNKRIGFNSTGAAVVSGDSDALAVLGFFFKLQRANNPKLNDLIRSIQKVRASGPSKTVKFEFACLLNLVKSELQGDFFRYFGGLTTPSCNEVVQWTVFTKAIGISASQLNMIRIGNKNGVGGDYFRDPQPLNGRIPVRFTANHRSNIQTCHDIKQYYCNDVINKPSGGRRQRPVYSITRRPVFYTSQRPVYSTTQRPVYNTSQRPVYYTSPNRQTAYQRYITRFRAWLRRWY